jgi:hypothetical protein
MKRASPVVFNPGRGLGERVSSTSSVRDANVVSSDEPDARTRSCDHVDEGRRCSRLRTLVNAVPQLWPEREIGQARESLFS